jgi:hypothetical protein
VNSSLLEKTDIVQYFCAENKNYSIFGNTYADRYRYLDFSLKFCSNSTFVPNERSKSCKSEKEIQNYIADNAIDLKFVFTNSFFDGNDFDQTIKYFMDDTFYWPLMQSMTRISNLLIKESEAVLSDNIFTSFIPPVSEYFF